MLKYDNYTSDKFKIIMTLVLYLIENLKRNNKYSYNWKKGGQFANQKQWINQNDDLFSNWNLFIFINSCCLYICKTYQHGNRGRNLKDTPHENEENNQDELYNNNEEKIGKIQSPTK